MKQHITVDQLLSLTPAQQAKLREWWVPEVGDWFYTEHYPPLLCTKYDKKYGEVYAVVKEVL